MTVSQPTEAQPLNTSALAREVLDLYDCVLRMDTPHAREVVARIAGRLERSAHPDPAALLRAKARK